MDFDPYALRAEFPSLCLTDDLSQVRNDPTLLSAFQQNLREGDIMLSWREILPPE